MVELDLDAPVAPPSWRQLAVLVLDASPSMDEPLAPTEGAAASVSKAETVDRAVRELVERLRKGRKAANFAIAMVAYAKEVTAEIPPVDLLDLPDDLSFNPRDHAGQWTVLASGLERAQEMISSFLDRERAGGLPTSAVVLAMTDGEDHHPDRAQVVADQLRSLPNTSVAACYFASEQPEGDPVALLQRVASTDMFSVVHSGDELRRFFESSISKVSGAVNTVGDGR